MAVDSRLGALTSIQFPVETSMSCCWCKDGDLATFAPVLLKSPSLHIQAFERDSVKWKSFKMEICLKHIVLMWSVTDSRQL